MLLTLTDPIAREFSLHTEAIGEVPFCAQVVTKDTIAVAIAFTLSVGIFVSPMADSHTALETSIDIQMLNELEVETTTYGERQLPISMVIFKAQRCIRISPMTISDICAQIDGTIVAKCLRVDETIRQAPHTIHRKRRHVRMAMRRNTNHNTEGEIASIGILNLAHIRCADSHERKRSQQ